MTGRPRLRRSGRARRFFPIGASNDTASRMRIVSVFRDGRSLAIVNPVAGGGRAGRRLESIVEIFKDEVARVDIVRTPASGEATRLARQGVADGYTRIIAIGG